DTFVFTLSRLNNKAYLYFNPSLPSFRLNIPSLLLPFFLFPLNVIWIYRYRHPRIKVPTILPYPSPPSESFLSLNLPALYSLFFSFSLSLEARQESEAEPDIKAFNIPEREGKKSSEIMPFIPNTPESKAAGLGRTDSLNPATTCRGVSVSTG